MGRLFGTDGIRGVANVEPMTVEMATKLGKSIAYIFKNERQRPKILIGKDTRLSGYMFENALCAGICSMGVDVLLVGPLPTPGIAFMTTSMRADAGIVISASHNPFQDNGIKIFSSEGFKLSEELEEKIEELVLSKAMDPLRPQASKIGKAFRIDDASGRYVVWLKNSFPKGLTLEGMKIILDCANGASYKVIPSVLEELGAELITIGVEPDGENINLGCGSQHPEVISQVVRDNGADLGIALDGDADRVIFADEKGKLVDGDHIMAICALEMIKQKRLKRNTLVATVMSNMGLDLCLKRAKGRVVRTEVGDKYVIEEMLRGGYNLGGEKSGHIVFLDHNTTGDGILTSLQVLAIMKKNGKRLSELSKVMTPLPQILTNVKIKRRREFKEIPEVYKTITSVEKRLKGKGRILVRFSGTEPVVRIMVEGEDKEEISNLVKEVAQSVEKHLGG